MSLIISLFFTCQIFEGKMMVVCGDGKNCHLEKEPECFWGSCLESM